jgi:hypothetical protein
MSWPSANSHGHLVVPSSLSHIDFDRFWEWTSHKRYFRSVATSSKAVTSEVINLLEYLNVFQTFTDAEAFVSSWRCHHPDTISRYELKSGLSKLSAFQYANFHRLIMALDKKDKKDKLRAQAISDEYYRKRSEREIRLEEERKRQLKDASLMGRFKTFAHRGFGLKHLFSNDARVHVEASHTIVTFMHKKQESIYDATSTITNSASVTEERQ